MEFFLKFMADTAPAFSELLILGDLFEMWVGDEQIEDYGAVMTALRNYRYRHGMLYVMHGNRDFLLGQKFCDLTGAVLISDPVLATWRYEPFLLSHGDQWCTLDEDYQQFRHTLRTADIQESILAEPLDNRKALAQTLRGQSNYDNSQKNNDVMDVVVTDVCRSARHANSHTIIHGHTHRPGHMTHYVDDFRLDRWVLPDWDMDAEKKRGGYLSTDSGFLHLTYF